MSYQSQSNGQIVDTYYNPNMPVDSRTQPVPPQQTPPALIPQPPLKPPQTPYERSMGSRIRYAILAGLLFLVFSLPVTYRVTSQIWGLFSSVPLVERPMLVPKIIQHPSGYQVQQMVEKPCGIGLRAIALHAAGVVVAMYIVLSTRS